MKEENEEKFLYKILDTKYKILYPISMQTFLVLGGTLESRSAFINSELQKRAIHPADHIIPPTDIPSIGIAHVRQLISQVMRRPMVGDTKALIIDTTTLTDEAQQALLKTLEEPPLDTVIFLSAASDTDLLPTILSRCTIITMRAHDSIPQNNYTDLWQSIGKLSKLQRLALIPDLGKEREEYRAFIQENILFLRSQLLQPADNSFSLSFLAAAIKQGLRALDAVEHNCNSKLALDYWIISL